MRHRLLLASLLAAACSKAEKPSPPPPAVPPKPAVVVQTAPVTRAVVPCPTTDLRQQAAASFGVRADQLGDTSCVALWSHDTTIWLLQVQVPDADQVLTTYAATRTPATAKPLWKSDAFADIEVRRYEVADLDGDGNDELLEYDTVGGDGVAIETLTVYTMSNGTPARADALPFRYDNTGAVAIGAEKTANVCRAEAKLVDSGKSKLLEVHALRRRGHPDATACPKTATYAFDGKDLVERVASR